jgi:glycosyltransferase involved in cell wall biosynthesis
MQRADVFILPSLFDGWGAVLNEAASVKKPLISTDECGAAYHLIDDKKNGFRVKAGSVDHLRKAMQFYIDNPEKIIIHGKISHQIYKNFTPDKNVEQFLYSLIKWHGQQKLTL